MFTPRTRIHPDSSEILASNRTFNRWLTRRSGCSNGRFSGPLRPVTAPTPRFRMLDAQEAQPFAEAVICAINSMMGRAADEDKYHGFRHVASMVCRETGEKYRRFEAC
jgi:hypothetical protein